MRKNRAYLYLLAAFILPLSIFVFATSSNSSDDDDCTWKFYRGFPKYWEGPQENASSSSVSTALTMAAENVELDLAGGTPTDEPVSGIAGQDSRCRYGPNTSFRVVSTLESGEQVIVLARTSPSDWLLVRTQPEGVECWVWMELLEVAGEVDLLPVASGPPLPTPSPTKKPGETPRLGCWVENDPQYPNGVCKPLPCGPNDYPATACELP